MSKRTKAQRKRQKQRKGTAPMVDAVTRVQESAQIEPQEPRKPKEDPRAVVIGYRMRIYGLTKEQAQHERAGTFIGRAFLKGAITNEHYLAGEWFKEAVFQYRNAVHSPGRQKGPSGFAAADSDDYLAYCQRAKETFEDICRVLRKRDIETRTSNSLGLLDAAVIRDVANWRQIEELRAILDLLDRWKKEPDILGLEKPA